MIIYNSKKNNYIEDINKKHNTIVSSNKKNENNKKNIKKINGK